MPHSMNSTLEINRVCLGTLHVMEGNILYCWITTKVTTDHSLALDITNIRPASTYGEALKNPRPRQTTSSMTT